MFEAKWIVYALYPLIFVFFWGLVPKVYKDQLKGLLKGNPNKQAGTPMSQSISKEEESIVNFVRAKKELQKQEQSARDALKQLFPEEKKE